MFTLKTSSSSIVRSFFLILVSLISLTVNAQDTLRSDSVERERARQNNIYARARRASIMSAILPGLGQAYNKKYWKIPVIYAALGGLGYLFVTNQQDYDFYRTNLAAEADDDPATLNTTFYDLEGLRELKRSSRNGRDFAALGIIVVYFLNIIDANVDAHLKTFDVSDNLGIRVSPWLGNHYCSAAGISITLKFKK
jgi:hypothetical protein